MNTRIEYRYKSAAGYVDNKSIIIDGELQIAQLIPYLKDGSLFIPTQVNLPALNGKDLEVDGPYHKLLSLDLTEDQPDIDITAVELLQKFKVACEEGWSEIIFFEEIAAAAAEACNRFVVQVPEALIHTAEFEVIMQSEFGDEIFKHFSLQLAFEAILRLYVESVKLDDGLERVVGLLVNPQVQNEFDEIVTVFRDQAKKQNFKVKLNDFSFACGKLGIGDPEKVTETQEYVFNDVNNFDHLKIFLKQNEFLVS